MDQRTDTSPSPAATLIDWVASVKLVTESEPVLILVWRGGSAAVQINIAVLWLIPAAMAYLTLVLNDAASRWTNAVVAAISALFALSTLISQPAGVSTGVNFVGIVGILVALLIIWHAWKWPREAEATPVTPSRQAQETARR